MANTGDSLLRVWRDPPAVGAVNMALDEALAAESARLGAVLVRLSTWDRPTLSLGAFQRLADARACQAVAGIDIVRRPSGGGAIVHGGDVTLAIAVPRGHPLGHTPQSLYDLVHGALVAELAERGVEARLSAGVGGPQDRSATPDGPLFCFDRRAVGDVVIPSSGGDPRGDAKILGSAQRRLPGAVLQHGSLLLEANRGVPPAARHPGLFDLVPATAGGTEALVDGWLARISRGFGSTAAAEPGPFAPGEGSGFRETLVRYSSPEWIGRK